MRRHGVHSQNQVRTKRELLRYGPGSELSRRRMIALYAHQRGQACRLRISSASRGLPRAPTEVGWGKVMEGMRSHAPAITITVSGPFFRHPPCNSRQRRFRPGGEINGGQPAAARWSAAISNFFILRNAWVTCSR